MFKKLLKGLAKLFTKKALPILIDVAKEELDKRLDGSDA